jgi:acetolactate synthase-1/3 small subunit
VVEQNGAHLMKRIISVLLENQSGSLSRVVGLFSQRGYNIDSLTVAPTEDATLSRLTLTTHCDDVITQQLTKQLNKLVDVVKVLDLTDGAHIERELMLLKVRASGAAREEIKRCVDIFRGQIVDVGPTTYVVQVTGNSSKLDSFIEALGDAIILEVVRTGISGIVRGEKSLKL